MRLKAVAAVLMCGSACLCQAANAQFAQGQIDALRQSVVRVDAHSCGIPGGAKFGSGFFWKQNMSVVTALHVVNGCSSLSVFSESASNPAKPSVGAHVQKILLDEDLVLLTLDGPIDGTTFVAQSNPAPTDTRDILLIGFPEDNFGSSDQVIKRQFGKGNTLDTIASVEAQKELRKSNSPSVTTPIIFLQAILEHGHSGGPIFDQQGAVIAIADGGLKHGVSEDSWAIPATDLVKLELSTIDLADMSKQSSTLLFAATPVQNLAAVVDCGEGRFKHTKTVSYSDVLPTADDPRGLKQLVDASGAPSAALAFEVYQDAGSGATIVLPKGETLTPQAGVCVAMSSGREVNVVAKVFDISNDPNGIIAGTGFEAQVMALAATPGWALDQSFSYLAPLPVAGGGFSLRKDWVHHLFFPGTAVMNPQAFDAQQFETIAVKGPFLLGVVAQNSRWNPLIVSTQRACVANPNAGPACPQALQDLWEWIESTLAVHLSTMAGL